MTNQEAIEIIKTAIAQVEWDYPMDYAAAFDKAIEALVNVNVAESVPVTRCTACKHWDANSGLTARKCGKWGGITKQFDYCSYGEGRTNGTDNP